jgi:hypothetical protein
MFSSFANMVGGKPTKPPKGAKKSHDAQTPVVAKETEIITATSAEIDSVASRSIKITFPKNTNLTSSRLEDDIYRAISIFGTIMDIRTKGKNAVVLYSTKAEAQRCIASWSDTSLSKQEYRVKSMGELVLSDSMTSFDGSDAGSVNTSQSQTNMSSILKVSGGESPLNNDGIAFDGSVIEANQTLKVMELEDVSNFDKTVGLETSIGDGSGGVDIANTSLIKNRRNETLEVDLVDTDADEDEDVDPYASDPKAKSVRDNGWKVADKPKTPPCRPDNKPNNLFSSGGKILTPQLVHVSRNSSSDDSNNNGGGAGTRPNDTYISSANDTMEASEMVSDYYSYGGDAGNSQLDASEQDRSLSLQYGHVENNNENKNKSLSAARSNYSLSDSASNNQSSHSNQSSSYDDNGNTFLTQGSAAARLPKKVPKPVPVDKSQTGGGRPLFQNILEIPTSSTVRSGSVMDLAENHNASYEESVRNKKMEEFQQERDTMSQEKQVFLERIRVLEAKERVMMRERTEYEENVKEIEERWSIEFMALSMRETNLKEENSKLSSAMKRAKIEITQLAAQIAAVEYAKNTQGISESNQKLQAERDARSTLMAQQKLIVALTSQKESSEKQILLLKADCDALTKSFENAVNEGTEYKLMAARSSEENGVLKAIVKSTTDENNENAAKPESESQLLALEEVSSRKVLNQELDRFLALQTSMTPPLPPNTEQAVYLYFNDRESRFGNSFNVATAGMQTVDTVEREKGNTTLSSLSKMSIPKFIKEVNASNRLRYNQ